MVELWNFTITAQEPQGAGLRITLRKPLPGNKSVKTIQLHAIGQIWHHIWPKAHKVNLKPESPFLTYAYTLPYQLQIVPWILQTSKGTPLPPAYGPIMGYL